MPRPLRVINRDFGTDTQEDPHKFMGSLLPGMRCTCLPMNTATPSGAAAAAAGGAGHASRTGVEPTTGRNVLFPDISHNLVKLGSYYAFFIRKLMVCIKEVVVFFSDLHVTRHTTKTSKLKSRDCTRNGAERQSNGSAGVFVRAIRRAPFASAVLRSPAAPVPLARTPRCS